MAAAANAIHLETPDYIVRTMNEADLSDGVQHWMQDGEATRNLNALPQTRTAAQLAEYVRRFDGVTSHLLGIFEKESGRLIGIRAIYVDHAKAQFLVNVLIGESDARNKGARAQSSAAMYRHFFTALSMQSAICNVVATNAAILKVMDANGWVNTRTGRKPAADGRGAVEVREFVLTREAWAKKQAERAAAGTR